MRLEPTPPEGLLKREEPQVLAVVGESVVTDGDFGGDLLDSPVPVPTSEPGPVLKTSATGAVPDWVKTLLPKQVQLAATAPPPAYDPQRAVPLPALDRLMVFRSVSPLYGDFLVRLLGQADTIERMQALESVLELSGRLPQI